MTTTPKTLKALEVREDSLVELESPANPKLELLIDPTVKPMMVQARTKAEPAHSLAVLDQDRSSVSRAFVHTLREETKKGAAS